MSIPEGRILIEFWEGIKIVYTLKSEYVPMIGDLVDFNAGVTYKVGNRKWIYSDEDPYRTHTKVQIHLEVYYTYR